MTIVEAIQDPKLFRPLFKSLDTWKAWLTVLRAIFGLSIPEQDLPLFVELTGRQTPPATQAEEAFILAGRRSGKSRMAALIALYLAAFKDYDHCRAAGERISVVVLACDRRQSGVIFRYVQGIIGQVAMLQDLVERETADTISLSNGVDIEIATNNFRGGVRGRTIGACVLDELAFWRNELSTNPDYEVLNALRPAMATVSNPLLIGISSTYRRSGALFDVWKKHFGKDSPILVVKADSQTLNPTISKSVIDKAMANDPEAARSEWFSEFRSDLSAFLDADTVERAIEIGCTERPPRLTINGEPVRYTAFVDPSGGQHDAMTLAIGHRENERLVIDVVRGINAPFSPEQAVKEFVSILRMYRLTEVTGDRYSGLWCAESFQKNGVFYRYSDLTKTECYLESLAPFSTGCVDLVDHKVTKVELLGLERRTSRSGRDSVDHPVGGRDDHANAVCGCLAMLASKETQQGIEVSMEDFYGGNWTDRGQGFF